MKTSKPVSFKSKSTKHPRRPKPRVRIPYEEEESFRYSPGSYETGQTISDMYGPNRQACYTQIH